MDEYDYKTARMIGVLLFTFGLITMMLMTITGAQQQHNPSVHYPLMENVTIVSTMSLLFVIAGLVLIWREKKGRH